MAFLAALRILALILALQSSPDPEMPTKSKVSATSPSQRWVSADGSTLPCTGCYFWPGDSLVPWIQHHSLDLLTDRILLLLGKQDVDAHYANSQP